jgi:hypothetical protein
VTSNWVVVQGGHFSGLAVPKRQKRTFRRTYFWGISRTFEGTFLKVTGCSERTFWGTLWMVIWGNISEDTLDGL